jgi:hypothetical protein
VTSEASSANDAARRTSPDRGPRKRREKGDGALHFRADKELWQMEIELPRERDGKRRRRVIY